MPRGVGLTAEHRGKISAANTRHGHAASRRPSRTYGSWAAMRQRCLNSSHPRYADYGGRGITVDPHWLGPDGFVNFLASLGERPAGTSLDRIDNDGNYEPGNVRWATAQQQRGNQRSHPFSTTPHAVYTRTRRAALKAGLPTARVLSTTPRAVYKCAFHAAKKAGLPVGVLSTTPKAIYKRALRAALKLQSAPPSHVGIPVHPRADLSTQPLLWSEN